MNRLSAESSPYLLQHANNPVDWQPWDQQSLALARRLEKPIFLSIGYSACHWCHVMEHESFENAEIAAILNEHYVPIKVDREERPDLDQVYMSAVQIMTGRGGWPMSVFLTPDLQPFYGGTYWPPTARGGMPGFDQVLKAVAEAWRERRAAAVAQAADLTEHLRHIGAPTGGVLSERLLLNAATALERSFDHQHGGFGAAPKFPHPMDLRVLLRAARRTGKSATLDMATITLDRMAAGGMYDQLGGGFHRYSVDERWLVPHFEKMLYDNALLAVAYLEGYLAAARPRYAEVVREICGYVLREMTDPAGGFYSTQDADSEGVEGKFFVWSLDEVRAVLGDKAETFARVYDVSEHGNFEESNILNLPKTISQVAGLLARDEQQLSAELAASRAVLLAAREKRIKPGLDDKVLVAWNGLMIDALAQAGAALDEPSYIAAAVKAADFVWEQCRRPDGRLLHSWRQGFAKLDAYLDDYAALLNAFVSLYEATFDELWIDRALNLAQFVLRHFADPSGGFFYTADDHEQLIARQKDVYDNATPSGNSLLATGLVRLAKLTGQSELAAAADGTLRAAAAVMQQAPSASGQMLIAYELQLGPTAEVVLTGPSEAAKPLLQKLRQRFWPNKVVAARLDKAPPGDSPLASLFQGKALAAEPALYICQNFACQSPATGHEAVAEAIDKASAR